MNRIKEIADKADMIVSGYAFTREEEKVHIVNLNHLKKELWITETGKVLKTTMDDIEVHIALDYWENNQEFMEELI